MKTKYFLLIIISLLLINYGLSTKEVRSASFFETKLSERNNPIFKIIKIDSIENIYLVYAERNDSIFKIMSLKEKYSNCRPIKLGELYNLKIISWFLPEEIHVRMRVTGVKFGNVIVKMERDSIVSDLFLTKNLEGLCYVSNPIETVDKK